MTTLISALPSGQWPTVAEKEDLMACGTAEAFSNWASLLPASSSQEDEHRSVYVKGRSSSNQSFFDDIRSHLLGVTEGLRLQMILGDESEQARAEMSASAHRLLLQGLHVAKGFLLHREYHKALALCEICVDLTDHLAMRFGENGELFWQILARVVLGSAYARFHKPAEAMKVLEDGIRFSERALSLPRSCARELALQGACKALLGNICLDLAADMHNRGGEASAVANIEKAAKLTQFGAVFMAKYLPSVPGYERKRLEGALAISTAYAARGVCAVRLHKYEEGYDWFEKAKDAIQEFAHPDSSGHRLLEEVLAHIEHTRVLQHIVAAAGDGDAA
mmetsp:Transcript_58253/g.189882  ORF Transcript_58253/g.189882 Transcript_58253/m.189882 type:complete len:335 (-) Transcript_58253:62-1066(-)